MNALSKFPVIFAGLAAACLAIPQARAMSFTYTLINIPGAVISYAKAINNHGVVVGWYFDSANLAHGFFLKNGVVTRVDAPGGTGGSRLVGIDSSGTAVGYGLTAGIADAFGFTYKPSSGITPIPYTGLRPAGVGRDGVIVGDYPSSVGRTGFALSSGPSGPLTSVSLDGLSTTLLAANAAGRVAGYQTTASGGQRAIFGHPDSPKTFSYPGAFSTVATGISKKYVFGFYSDGGLNSYGFRRANDGSVISVSGGDDDFANTEFNAASDNSNVAGTYLFSPGQEIFFERPIYYSSTGVLTRLYPNGSASGEGFGVNGVGQMVGIVEAHDGVGDWIGFIATCVKTPGTTTCAP